MSQVGASLEQLDLLASEFQRQGAAAATLRSAITARLGETLWIGASAQTFRERWSQDYDPMLRRLEQELAELGGYVARKRAQLHEAGNL
jgi:uncharacterized protein YukE